jgi:hypothetical protein
LRVYRLFNIGSRNAKWPRDPHAWHVGNANRLGCRPPLRRCCVGSNAPLYFAGHNGVTLKFDSHPIRVCARSSIFWCRSRSFAACWRNLDTEADDGPDWQGKLTGRHKQEVSETFDANGLGRQTRHNGTIEQKGLFPGLSNGRGPPVFDEKGRHGENVGRPKADKSTPDIPRLRSPDKPRSALSRLLRANGIQSHRIERLNANRRSIITEHRGRLIVVTFAGASTGRRSTAALKKLARALGEVRP